MMEYRGAARGGDLRSDEDSPRSYRSPSSTMSSSEGDHPPAPHKCIAHIKQTDNLSDSLVSRMATLHIDSPHIEDRPKNPGLSPPKFSSSLVLTTNHPLMLTPDDFPDVVPKKVKEEDVDNSLSSIEDDKSNGYFYDPSMNNSKNNLYFSDNFTTADSQVLDSQENSLVAPPDVARVNARRRKIIPIFVDKLETSGNSNDTASERDRDENSAMADEEEREQTCRGQSTPKVNMSVYSVAESEYYSGMSSWQESFWLRGGLSVTSCPDEAPSRRHIANGAESPDVISRSPEDRSQYEAVADPRTGHVTLRHARLAADRNDTQPDRNLTPRRKIQVPYSDDDVCSVDSVTDSLGDEEEEPPLPPLSTVPPPPTVQYDSDDDTRKSSKSGGTCSSPSSLIPEYSLQAELRNERSWITVTTQGRHHACDLKVIEPFKRALSHGGYARCGAAVLVLSACFLPDTGRPDYTYVMDHLFLYVMWTLDRLVSAEYILVYLHAPRTLPTLRWLHQCYTLIDRRLRKSLKQLYLVHPTFWLKCLVLATKPFVSSKFFRKVVYVKSLAELEALVRVEPNAIPQRVRGRHCAS